MAFGDIMTRAEMIAFLVKADLGLKGLGLEDLEKPNDAWIKNYLEERSVGFMFDTVKARWYWSFYKYYAGNMGKLSLFDPDRKLQRSEMIKMNAMAFGYK